MIENLRSLSETIPNLVISDSETRDIYDDLYVERMTLRRSEGRLHVYICSEHPVHKRIINKLERQIAERLSGGMVSVSVHERFRLSAQYTAETLLDEYKDSIMYELKAYSPILANIFRNTTCVYENGRIMLKLPSTVVSEDKGDELAMIIDRIINERCGLSTPVSLSAEHNTIKMSGANTDILKNAARDITSRIYNDVPEAEGGSEEVPFAGSKTIGSGSADEQPSSEGKWDKKGSGEKAKDQKFTPKDPDTIYGRDVPDEPLTDICDIDELSGRITIHGQIISSDYRELKSGKWIIALAVTDFTDSIKVKLFVTAESAEELKPLLKSGVSLKIKGTASFDSFDKEVMISSVAGIKKIPSFKQSREDLCSEKRIELHCHTKMSDMDGIADAGDLVKQAYKWGHPGIAITDHGVVQGFPIANHAVEDIDSDYVKKYAKAHPEAAKDELKKLHAPFKVVYGVEAYLVDDLKKAVRNADDTPVDSKAVVFDIETTGFSPIMSKIIEIGAVKVENGKITDRFSAFVNPKVPIPYKIEKLTGITDNMVINEPDISMILPEFMKFCEGCYLVAHNADFDTSFIRKNCKDLGLDFNFSYTDTVALSRYLLPELKNYKLDTVAKRLGVSLENHHRAVDDAECTAHIYLDLAGRLKSAGVSTLAEINEKAVIDADTIKKLPSYHAIILARNETGRVNLYTLISKSHIEYFHSRPRIPKSVYKQYSEGLLIGSACEAGELYRAMLRGATDNELAETASFYDYIEIQPVGNNEFMIADENNDMVSSEDDIRELNKKIAGIGEALGKPVVATGDVHFLNPEDEVYRRIIMAGMGYPDADHQAPLYFRTTDDMLEEFAYFGPEKAREYVIDNPRKVFDMCERVSPIRQGKFPPVIENSDNDLREICYRTAHEVYGEDLPKIVTDRLERELTSIISNGYAVMYIIAQKLVTKSNEDGYLVGSRGSVGSSFVATMSGITEVNPLSPHYLCPECHYVDFDSEDVKKYAGRCGFDMPDKNCPVCGSLLKKMGFDIPFETFLGFKGNKEPDIDLNFSGEYQSKAHKYTEVIFGEGHTFRAGTISTLADKTAYGYVKKYFEERGINKRGCEMDRIVAGCTGIRRSTGQHPGGIVVLPHGENINSFTPIQRPANDMTTDTVTTHFEYHSIDQNLLKLDILGHDDPTMIRMLKDITGTDPLAIPLDEPNVMSLFQSTKALGIKPEDIGGCKLGCLGVPEFGTDFVIGMLLDTKPSTFSELVRISGLSHGTDVWLGNAQTLIVNGDATLSTAICTRDDIMLFLIQKGMESELSFTIMESVRKGKGLKPEWEEMMREHDVPEWYIWSCKKIKYMFPKAHAAAYVMMAYRIAWYKIYYPQAYYAAYFSIRATAFNYEQMCMGKERLQYHIDEILNSSDPKKADQDALKDMKIVREMYARGIEFLPIDIYKADPKRFTIIDGKLMAALNTIKDVGDTAAEALSAAARERRFTSKDDLKSRGKVSAKSVEYMASLGLLDGLPETDQLSFFDM